MKHTLKIACAALLGATAVTATSVAAVGGTSGDPVYYTLYYSDATLTEQVGSVNDICFSWGVAQGPTQGQQTEFTRQILTGYCVDGVLVIY